MHRDGREVAKRESKENWKMPFGALFRGYVSFGISENDDPGL